MYLCQLSPLPVTDMVAISYVCEFKTIIISLLRSARGYWIHHCLLDYVKPLHHVNHAHLSCPSVTQHNLFCEQETQRSHV